MRKQAQKTGPEGNSFRQIVGERFRHNRPARWSLRILYVLIFIALFADFLANEKPLYCQLERQHYFPVLKDYAVSLGIGSWESRFVIKDWREQPFERVWWAPIPYSATTIDRRNMNFRAPFGQQNVASWRFRHWLGTDELGRDVAAGMIRGTRIALLVGLIAMSIASLIGIGLGTLAGYFGDDQLRVSRARLLLNLLGLVLGFFYAFSARSYALQEGPLGWQLLLSLLILVLVLVAANLLAAVLGRLPWLSTPLTVPLDLIIMRLIEVINSIPSLLLILSVVAIISNPSIFSVMVIIGLLSWTGIARFVRAEFLRIRKREYIEAARALGYSRRRIILRHALPNALTAVLITIAFGIATAILIEASLSFLGIGMAAEEVTWGQMLSLARQNFKAWWLALLPGFAIFVTVTVFNLLGEGLTEALDPRLRTN